MGKKARTTLSATATAVSPTPERRLQRVDLIDHQQPADASKVEPVTFVKRPGSNKPKKPSQLRTSFAPAEDDPLEDEDTPARTVRRPASKLKRSLPQRSDRSPSSDLPLRDNADDRPTYDLETLAALKSSTPTTAPSHQQSTSPTSSTEPPTQALDIASKFGTSTLALSHDPLAPTTRHIPTALEIAEKKERRRRLAQEHNADPPSSDDFISLDDNSGDFSALNRGADSPPPAQSSNLIIPAEEVDLPSKYGVTRLEHEDEDIAEGFDAFVEDAGKVSLKGKAAREQERQRRKGMEEQIRAAQHGYGYSAAAGGGSDDSAEEEEEEEVDKEEVARMAAYEAAQTKAGTYGNSHRRGQEERDKEERQRQRLEMPRVKPVPELKSVVARFGDMVRGKEGEVKGKRDRLERVRREQVEIGREEERVRLLLKEAGERFEQLRGESAGKGEGEENNGTADGAGQGAMETFRSVVPDGAAGAAMPAAVVDSSEEEDGAPGFGGLGSLNGRTAGTGVSGMAAFPKDEDEDDYY